MAYDKWNVEYTDTFSGEANYSWIRRGEVELIPHEPDHVYSSAVSVARARRAYNRELVMKAKALVGLTGTRGRMYNSRTVMFITFTGN